MQVQQTAEGSTDMSEDAQRTHPQKRVSKREYIAGVAERSGLPATMVSQVYEAGIAELLDIVVRGDRVMLTGFGRFYPQAHKGHRVQFADGQDGEGMVIDDYSVLKFSATREVNKLLDAPRMSADQAEGG